MKTTAISGLMRSTQDIEDATRVLSRELLGALAALEDSAIQRRLLKDLVQRYVALEKRVEGLLQNTLPPAVAEEIKRTGGYPPRSFDGTILFTDCAGFTRLAERMPAEMLIQRLHTLFSGLDEIVRREGGTKIKTIGDSYMAFFGAPDPLPDHAVRAVRAALACQAFLLTFNEGQPLPIEMRIGVHSGQVMGGVVGHDRMQFDVFGDAVNTASRFESSGEKGRVNVSERTWEQAREEFTFEPRGEIPLKNKAPMRAFFVTGPRPVGKG